MTYVIVYRIGGIGRYFLDGMFDDSDDAQRHARAQTTAHPGRAYEMHPVHPSIAELLGLPASVEASA